MAARKKTVEYTMTAGTYGRSEGTTEEGYSSWEPRCDEPVLPEGAGWEMVSHAMADGYVTWSWIRRR